MRTLGFQPKGIGLWQVIGDAAQSFLFGLGGVVGQADRGRVCTSVVCMCESYMLGS